MSCSNTKIEFPNTKKLIVVEGWITNQLTNHTVKITQTVGFQDSGNEETVTNAIVSIEDNISNIYTSNHIGNGIYQTEMIAGQVDVSYRVRIVLENGNVILSGFELLNTVPDIRALAYTSFVRENPNTGEDIDIYYPIVAINDLIDEENFYWYRGFRDGIYLVKPNEFELTSDQFVNGQNFFHSLSRLEYTLGENITIEVYSVSQRAYSFLKLLRNQTTSLGSPSRTSPATINGNLFYEEDDTEEVLGFFGASAVSTASVTVTIIE